ncbi:hypothetical protein P3S68_033466 [Capsicum galapagoense]
MSYAIHISYYKSRVITLSKVFGNNLFTSSEDNYIIKDSPVHKALCVSRSRDRVALQGVWCRA